MSTKTLTETFLFLKCLSDLQDKNPDQDIATLHVLCKFHRIISNIKIL